MREQISLADLPYLMPGEVLSTFANGVEHFGLLTDRHLYGWPPSIVSASKTLGFVTEELPLQFAPSRQLFAHGYWSQQHRMLTVRIALSKLGQPYRLFELNCEHFVRICQGLPAESPQLAGMLGIFVAAGVVYGLAKIAA